MLNESITEATVKPTLQAAQVYAMAVVCLVLGLAVGYLFRASEIEASPAQTAVNSSSTTPGGATGGSAPSTSGAMIQTPAGNLAQSAAGASPQSPHGSAMGKMCIRDSLREDRGSMRGNLTRSSHSREKKEHTEGKFEFHVDHPVSRCV